MDLLAGHMATLQMRFDRLESRMDDMRREFGRFESMDKRFDCRLHSVEASIKDLRKILLERLPRRPARSRRS